MSVANYTLTNNIQVAVYSHFTNFKICYRFKKVFCCYFNFVFNYRCFYMCVYVHICVCMKGLPTSYIKNCIIGVFKGTLYIEENYPFTVILVEDIFFSVCRCLLTLTKLFFCLFVKSVKTL